MIVSLPTRSKKTKKITADKYKIKPLTALLTSVILLGSSGAYAQETTPQEAISQDATPQETIPQDIIPQETDVNEILEEEPTSAGGKRDDGINELVTIGVREVVAKKLATIHEQPFSQSIVSGATLDRELGLDYEAMSKRLANVTFNQNNTRGASLSIRGVGKRAFAEVQDPSVLVIQDGVSFGLTALGNFDFYDIETVEAFRGPQGTLGGKGGSSGAVYVTTKRPGFESSGELSIAYGERDSVILKGAYGGAVIDDLLAWRGSFIVDKQRGYYENRYDENFSLYNKNRTSGRLQLLLTPTPELNALLSVDVEPRAAQLQNGLTFYHTQPERYADGSLTDPSGTTAKAKLDGFVNSSNQFTPARGWFVGRDFGLNNIYSYADYIGNEADETVYFNENRGQTVSNKGASLNIDYAFEKHIFNSITAWRNYSFDARNDEGTPFDISVDGGGGVDYKQYSQEFSIESDKNENFDYIAGIIFFQTEDNIVSKTGWGSDAGAWFATTAQYNTLDRNAGINRGAGKALLHDSLASGRKRGDTWVETESNAIYGNSNWHWHDSATLTLGLRVGSEDRTTTDEVVLETNGTGAALNPVSVRGYDLGGFNNTIENNTDAQKQLADTVAYEYYGATITGVPGAAYQSLSAAQKAQIAAAKALRATQIGQLIPRIESHYDDTLYTGFLSQSYEFNEKVRGYASWQYGEKSGTAFNINGATANVKPEITNSYELGLKTFLFEDTLTLNADIFAMDIDDYQQAIRVVDEWLTQDNINNGIANPTAYTTAQGNVNKVRVEGVEFDGVYTGIENISIRFSGAYNDAYYKDFKNSPKPAELTYLTEPFVDQTGKNLPGASKWTVNFGVEYRVPVLSAAEFHTSFNTAYWSDYLNADDLSEYSYFPSGARTDAAIGLSSQDGNLDVSLIVKNAFDDRTHEEGWTSYSPWPYPRWFGVVFTGKF